jgi:coenzyme F420-reducing hydrogenase alpha subunit
MAYQDKTRRTQFIIDAYAMYHTAGQIMSMLEQTDDFKEEKPITKSTVSGYKIQHADDIKKRRAEITDKALPILDPSWRLTRYQEIVEESLEGREVFNRTGDLTGYVKDFKSAITALAQVDKVTGYGKEDDEKESVRKMMKSILEELRADLLKTCAAPEDVEAIISEKEKEFASEMVM